jgi:tryptophan synthase beta chain
VETAGKGTESGFTAATLHNGRPGVLHGSKTMLLQTSDGQITEPYSISAGLDYPGIGPMHADLFRSGRADYIAVTDREALEAASELAKLEGIIPALESAHAFAALKKIKFQPEQVVVINLSGRGDKDLQTYIRELSNV